VFFCNFSCNVSEKDTKNLNGVYLTGHIAEKENVDNAPRENFHSLDDILSDYCPILQFFLGAVVNVQYRVNYNSSKTNKDAPKTNYTRSDGY
jgi:hypothetical protein